MCFSRLLEAVAVASAGGSCMYMSDRDGAAVPILMIGGACEP